MNSELESLEHGSTRSIIKRRLVLLACLILTFLIYLRTLAPTVYTFDSAEFATGAYVLGIIHSTGYPFYLLLAKLFTLLPVSDDIAYRVNLMSAVWGAVTIALLFVLCDRLTQRVWLSAAVALLYAFSHYFWPAAVIAETYTLNTTLFLILVLLLTAPRDRIDLKLASGSGLVFGLGLANHMSTILLVPALMYWALAKRVGLKSMLAFGLCTLAGLGFYLYLPIRYAADPPLNYAKTFFDVNLLTPGGIWSWMTGEMFRQFMAGYDAQEILGEIVQYLGWLWTNFLGAGLLVGIVGIVTLFRRDLRLFIFFALVYLSYTAFFVNYRVVNKDTMFNVSYLVWAVWIAYGALAIHTWVTEPLAPHAFNRAAQIRHYITPALVSLLALISMVLNYSWADQSNNRMASDFATALLDRVEPSAFVVTEWTWATPLEYMQIVLGRRPDVTIFDRGLYGLAVWNRSRQQGYPDSAAGDRIEQAVAERIQSEITRRPVYATAFDQSLAPYFSFVPILNFFKLEPRTGLVFPRP